MHFIEISNYKSHAENRAAPGQEFEPQHFDFISFNLLIRIRTESKPLKFLSFVEKAGNPR